MLKYIIFEGGQYKHEILEEFLEDIGGFIVQRVDVSLDLILNLAVPEEEVQRLNDISAELKA
jgi:methyl coenzyme M reductase subunit C-like uncharacterized protein (methanogenesis marker protein 7)